MALLQWASQLRWLPRQGHVTYVEVALDFEAHAERALPAPSDHRLRGVTLPLRTTGRVLKMALDALQPHLQAGDLLQGKEVWMAKSLLPLGALGVWGGRRAHCSRARTPCCSKCASWRRTAARYGCGAWRGRKRGGRMCSYYPPGRTRAAAHAALSALAAPASAARPARGRRRGRGPLGTAATGPVCATPGPALCRLRAAGRRALLPAGSRRAPHGRGASARGGASVAGVAAARAAGRGWLRGGVPGRAGLAKHTQTLPLAISLTSARDTTSAPSRARVRATPRGALSPPPLRLRGGGGTAASAPRAPPPEGWGWGSYSPLPPHIKGHSGWGGNRTGQPRRPMQTLCDEHRAPACKSCKGKQGGATLLGASQGAGGVQRCLPVQGGGGGGGLQQQLGTTTFGGPVGDRHINHFPGAVAT